MLVLNWVDNLLNGITMYRLALYVLSLLSIIAFIFSFLNLIPYSPLPLIISLTLLLLFSFLTNSIFAKIFKAPANTESFWITALILFFLLPPPTTVTQSLFVILAAVIAMASKFLMSIKKKHIFNPAAFSILILGYLNLYGPSWWAGDTQLIPFVVIGGLLVVRKIRRFQMVLTFLVVALCVQLIFATSGGFTTEELISTLKLAITASPLIFFATIMLTEPQTTPPTKKLQMMYATLIGVLYSFQAPIGPLYSSPELALLVGNVFAYIVSPKGKHILTFQKKIEEGKNLYSYVFAKNDYFDFSPGQYLEWTLPPKNADSRGNRRYFTIASSPTEDEIRLGVKFNASSSSFKKYLQQMKKGDTLTTGQLSGDFTLPLKTNEKLVWISGGIGVTPFRSMTKYLVDTTQKRDIVFFYAVANANEFAFKELFDKSAKKIGMKNIYVVTKKEGTSKNWHGKIGYITEDMIKKEVPGYKNRTYYLSGPIGMVNTYKELLAKLGIKKNKIVTDYFPGFT